MVVKSDDVSRGGRGGRGLVILGYFKQPLQNVIIKELSLISYSR